MVQFSLFPDYDAKNAPPPQNEGAGTPKHGEDASAEGIQSPESASSEVAGADKAGTEGAPLMLLEYLARLEAEKMHGAADDPLIKETGDTYAEELSNPEQTIIEERDAEQAGEPEEQSGEAPPESQAENIRPAEESASSEEDAPEDEEHFPTADAVAEPSAAEVTSPEPPELLPRRKPDGPGPRPMQTYRPMDMGWVQYSLPETALNTFIAVANDIRHFADHFALSADDLRRPLQERERARIEAFARGLGLHADEALLNGELLPADDNEFLLLNIRSKLAQMDEEWDLPVDEQWLRQAHQQLSEHTSQSSGGGLFRWEVDEEAGTDAAAAISRLRSAIELAAYAPEPHAVVNCLISYMGFRQASPFANFNEPVCKLAMHQMFSARQQDFAGLLPLEFLLFSAENSLAIPALGSAPAEVTEWLESALLTLIPALEFVHGVYERAVAADWIEPGMRPQELNSIHFWLRHGYKVHERKMQKLNDRQRDIVGILARSGHVAIRNLVPVLRSDRGTIQQDLDLLCSLGIARVKGHGRDIVYVLDMKFYI